MKTLSSRDVPQITLTVFTVIALITSVFWIARPFLPSIIWATMIVVATWPLMLLIQKKLWGKRGLAAATMTVALLLVFVIPLWLAVATIVNNAGKIEQLTEAVQKNGIPSPPQWLDKVPLAGPRITDCWKKTASEDTKKLQSRLEPYVIKVIKWFADQAGNVGKMFVQFFLTVIITAILYMKGDRATEDFLRFSRRLGGNKGEEAVILAARAIRGVALGVVVTALVQSILGGIGIAVTGVPAATLLTAVMFILCIAQIGAAIVLIPAIVWLYWSGHPISGTVLIFFTVFVVSLDNILRPILIKKGADLSLLLIFTGVIGGLMAFGIVGIFIGPVVLAVANALFKAWVDQENTDPTPNV